MGAADNVSVSRGGMKLGSEQVTDHLVDHRQALVIFYVYTHHMLGRPHLTRVHHQWVLGFRVLGSPSPHPGASSILFLQSAV